MMMSGHQFEPGTCAESPQSTSRFHQRKFQVQIGAQGTDDDVRIKVCSDDKNDKKACCTTPPLKKTFSDDWSSNDLEQWGPYYFGPCKGKKFLVRRGLDG